MAIVYQTFSPGDANIRAYVVEDRGAADILVHAVKDMGAAHGDAIWYIARQPGMASSKLHFGSRGFAQLLVYFVAHRAEAKWQRPHPLKGKL